MWLGAGAPIGSRQRVETYRLTTDGPPVWSIGRSHRRIEPEAPGDSCHMSRNQPGDRCLIAANCDVSFGARVHSDLQIGNQYSEMSKRSRRWVFRSTVFVGAVAGAAVFAGVAKAELPSAPADSVAAAATQPAVAATPATVQSTATTVTAAAPSAPPVAAPPAPVTTAPLEQAAATATATVEHVSSAAAGTATKVVSTAVQTTSAPTDIVN